MHNEYLKSSSLLKYCFITLHTHTKQTKRKSKNVCFLYGLEIQTGIIQLYVNEANPLKAID